jgi:hypothetical protein
MVLASINLLAATAFAGIEAGNIAQVAQYTTDTRDLLAFGTDRGAGGLVSVFRTSPGYLGTHLDTLTPFGSFTGGVRVAVGDVNGDGFSDLIVAAGPGGGPHVKVIDGTSLGNGEAKVIQEFFAFDTSFTGGVNVAAGDLDGDGKAEVIVGANSISPQVKVFGDGSVRLAFFAFEPAFSGGVRVAAGDVNGDGRAEIVVAAGPGGGPHVKVFDGVQATELAGFFAFDPAFRGGVFVAAGDVNGDGFAEIVAGAGPGGSPQVSIFDGDGLLLRSFFAYSPTSRAGAKVGLADPAGYRNLLRSPNNRSPLPRYSIVVTPGSKGKAPVKFFDGTNGNEILIGGTVPFGLSWSKGLFPTP